MKKNKENQKDVSTDDFSSSGDELEIVGEAAPAASSEDLEKAKRDYLYLLAEFENFKKHSIKERSDLIKYGSERIILGLLEVLDNFNRAMSLDKSSTDFETFRKGIELTQQELNHLLQKFGVQKIESAGGVFNPALHEALSAEETDAVPAGTVTSVFRDGYRLHDRIIRPAQVVVAREKVSKGSTEN